MIESGYSYIAILFLIAGLIAWVEHKIKLKLFKILPAIVILYFTIMLFSTFGLWHKTDAINTSYKTLKGGLLPVMIFLLLLKGDIRQIAALGPRMIIAFIAASSSIVIGFILTFLALKAWLPDTAWQSFAALSGSWMGGTGNMVAVQEALSVKESAMGYALLMDSINYAVWVMFLLALVPFATRFNKWSKGDTSLIARISKQIEMQSADEEKIETANLIFLLGIGLVAAALAKYFAGFVPESDFFSATTWTVLIVTLFGIIGAMTPLGKISGSAELGGVMLYGIVALIASRANFAELSQAPIFVLAGFMILAFHALVMLIIAKLLRLDLFSCGVASLANIGGVASAPILAASYSRALIPVGVLMAMIGYIIGTGGGLLVGKILSGLS